MKRLILIVTGLCLTGCAYPVSTIDQGSEAGHLRFVGGPPGAIIRIDGQDRGAISASGPTIIDVEAGNRLVEEVAAGQTIFQKTYEVGQGSTINIGDGN